MPIETTVDLLDQAHGLLSDGRPRTHQLGIVAAVTPLRSEWSG
jgi:hypothetical protein